MGLENVLARESIFSLYLLPLLSSWVTVNEILASSIALS